MNENSLALILKLIAETKEGHLRWCKYDTLSNELKPEKADIFSPKGSFSGALCEDYCYMARHESTFFFLITQEDILGYPYIVLYAQTHDSAYSKAYASTSGSAVNIISELKRLYNIVESLDDPIDNSIRAFIDF